MSELSLPLSNVQMELLRLYSTNLSEEDLNDLKIVLSRFFSERSISLANDIWDKRGLSDEDMDRLLNAPNQ